MQRAYHKSWQDRRPDPRRSVKWYEGRSGNLISIRLVFTDFDEGRKTQRFYADRDDATKDYEAFIAGATVISMREKE